MNRSPETLRRQVSSAAKTMQEVANDLLHFATLVGDCGAVSAIGDHELLDLTDKLNAASDELVPA